MRKIRVFYEKRGNLRYVSHLDMNRFMSRLIARAGLPVLYTEGYNPHPYINISLPLSLGFESSYETVDFKVADEIKCEDIFNMVSGAVPPGMRVVRVADVVHKSGDIRAARYEIVFENAVSAALREALGSAEIIVTKKTKKGGETQIDIKPHISEAEVCEGDGLAVLTLVLPAGSNLTINPMLLCDFLIGQVPGAAACGVTRTMLYVDGGKEFV